jgi:inner membrane protein
MASVISHAVFASSLGSVGAPASKMPVRYWVTLALVAALPDLDVVVYPLGLNAPHMLGHRGLTHSLPFAAVCAALIVRLVFRDVAWRGAWTRLWLVFFAAMASHGILDAMTDGGQGIAFFAPFSDARWHFPWRPIRVSPIGVGAFISTDGLRVLQNELLSVWMPSLLIAVAARLLRRRSSHTKAMAA